MKLSRNIARGPYPASCIRTLTYETVVNVGSAISTGPYPYVIRANSIWDPQYIAGGDNPYGYDQLAAMYKKYYVISSKIKVEWFPNGAVANLATMCNGRIFTGGEATLGAVNTQREMFEAPFGSKVMTFGHWDITDLKRYGFTTAKWNAAKEFKEVIDTDLGADVTSDPAVENYYVFCYMPNNTAEVMIAPFKIRVEYKTLFYQPAKVETS